MIRFHVNANSCFYSSLDPSTNHPAFDGQFLISDAVGELPLAIPSKDTDPTPDLDVHASRCTKTNTVLGPLPTKLSSVHQGPGVNSTGPCSVSAIDVTLRRPYEQIIFQGQLCPASMSADLASLLDLDVISLWLNCFEVFEYSSCQLPCL